MEVYVVQEYHTDVVCTRMHTNSEGKDYQCKAPINCARRIHAVVVTQEEAIKLTKDKPTWSYETFEMVIVK